MKFARGATPQYRYGQKVKPRHFAAQPKPPGRYTALVFIILALSFSTSLKTINQRDAATTPDGQLTTVSSRGKIGASRPTGVAANVAAGATKKLMGSSTKDLANKALQSAPSLQSLKPAWVSLPLYTDPTNGAAQYLAANPSVNGAAYIKRMAQVPTAQWFGDWNTNVTNDVDAYVSAAAATGSVPVVVAYNIPNRDCGGYSVGGAGNITNYTQWVRQVAAGIGERPAVVILEPDALGALDCLPASQQQERTQSIAQAVTILKTHVHTAVYIDAGTPVWQPAKTMAARLQQANVAAADGFSLNVSYFATTAQNRAYGDQLSSLVGYKHYVIDTSRNGGNHAVTGMQCNPSWASFGDTPTTNTGSALNDALLWIKIPWESDGACDSSPGPGEPYWSYAIQLAQNAGW